MFLPLFRSERRIKSKERKANPIQTIISLKVESEMFRTGHKGRYRENESELEKKK